MGPTNRMLSISPDVEDPAARAITFDELRAAFAEQVRGLIDGGADLILVETIIDGLNAKAAIAAIEDVADETGVRLPLMISVTITDRSGRTLAGQTIEAFWITVAHARPVQHRRQLRPRRGRHAPVPDGPLAASPPAGPAATPTPACPTPSASTTRGPTRPPASCASSRPRGW